MDQKEECVRKASVAAQPSRSPRPNLCVHPRERHVLPTADPGPLYPLGTLNLAFCKNSLQPCPPPITAILAPLVIPEAQTNAGAQRNLLPLHHLMIMPPNNQPTRFVLHYTTTAEPPPPIRTGLGAASLLGPTNSSIVACD